MESQEDRYEFVVLGWNNNEKQILENFIHKIINNEKFYIFLLQ